MRFHCTIRQNIQLHRKIQFTTLYTTSWYFAICLNPKSSDSFQFSDAKQPTDSILHWTGLSLDRSHLISHLYIWTQIQLKLSISNNRHDYLIQANGGQRNDATSGVHAGRCLMHKKYIWNAVLVKNHNSQQTNDRLSIPNEYVSPDSILGWALKYGAEVVWIFNVQCSM